MMKAVAVCLEEHMGGPGSVVDCGGAALTDCLVRNVSRHYTQLL